MARRFPSTLDGVSATPGEARLFDLVAEALPGEAHWLWFRPLIESPGKRLRRPPFVLLGPGYGVVVLGVADGQARHPEREAREGAAVLRQRLETVGVAVGEAAGAGVSVAWGVLCPDLRARELGRLREKGVAPPPGRALTREDLADGAALTAALGRLGRDTSGASAARAGAPDEALRERVRAAVEPQLHFLDPREGALPAVPVPPADPVAARAEMPPTFPGFWLDRKQERMARELASPRTLVYGPAGSGKTVFLVSRAQYWLGRRPGARVLFTCYNASLASHLRRVFADRGLPPDGDRLTVRHYHDLCGAILDVSDIHERSPEFYAALEPRVLGALARSGDIPLYDLILVDEGQDMTRRMMEVLVRLNAPGGEITVVSDPAQDIYSRWSEDTLAPLRDLGVERLVDCYRNTAPIFSLALAVLDADVRREMGLGRLELTRPEDLGRLGPAPELPALGGLDDLVDLVGEVTRDFRREGRPLSELAVLYPDRHAVPGFAERVRASRWQAAADPRFAEERDEERRESAVGTLHPRSDRDDLPFSERPHFAEALERELLARDVPAEWVARDFASKAAYDITRSRLTLSTIHSAKGMDFHTVLLLGAETLATGRGTAGRRAQSLLFTGITRARERLLLPYFEDEGWVPELRRRVEGAVE